MEFRQKIMIITGHYGCGKTNFSLNLARQLSLAGPVTLVDLDVVNPYFRVSDFTGLLPGNVKVILPNYSRSTLDVPAISPEVYSVFGPGEGHVIFDAGGDDAGATALGRFSDHIKNAGYEMLYVVNQYRMQVADPRDAAAMLRDIERASRLKATGIINNSHLGGQTDAKIVLGSIPYAREVARVTGLPLAATVTSEHVEVEDGAGGEIFKAKILVKSPWQV